MRALSRSPALRRTGQSLLVLVAAFTASFLLLQALPGDGVLIKFMSPELGLSAAQVEEIRQAYGGQSSLPVRYAATLFSFLIGDFGHSLQSGVPVRDLIAANLAPTLWLAGFAFLAAAILAGVLAVLSSLAGFAWLRALIQAAPGLFVSIPTFWLGIVLIQTFSFQLRLVPVIGAGPWQGLILPVATLAVPISAPLAQILIRNMAAVEAEPFVTVARAKGSGRWRILYAHVARNALLPTLTIAGILFGELLAGAVVTETVFGLNGLGRLTQQAVANQDVAVLQAIVVLSASAFVLINLAVDLIYPLLDPRLSSSKERGA